MAQDERKGQSGTRSRSPAASMPDTPDLRNMTAAPLPETPVVQESEAPAAEGRASGRGAVGAAGAGAAGGSGAKSKTDQLRKAIADAERDLAEKKAELDRVEALHKAEEAAAKLVEDYSTEVAALKASEEGLKQYRRAETSFLSQFLDAEAMRTIEGASAAQQRETDALASDIESDAKKVAAKQNQLEAAKKRAAAAKAAAEALKRPVASARERLKAADAIRTEAMKASDAGNYALAYWLTMDGGLLDEKIGAARVIPASELGAAVRAAAEEQRAADAEASALEDEVKALESALKAARTQLAARSTGSEARLRASLAQFNPKPAPAA